jgi:transposase
MTTRRTPSHEIKGPGGTLSLRPDDEAVLDLVMLIEGETSGRDLDEILGQFGRSRSTYYEKLRRFREQGLEGLLPRPPGPRTAWRRPLEVIRFVVTTRLRNPDRTAAEIADELTRLGHSVSARSVERTLSQFGLTRLRAPQAAGTAPTPAPVAGAAVVAPQAADPATTASAPAARTTNGTVE